MLAVYPRCAVFSLAPCAESRQTRAMRPWRVASLALLSLLLVAQGTQAGGPGKWTMVTERTARNTTQVGFVRTKDGVLHVAWAESGVNPTLWHVGIRPNGQPSGAKNAIVTGFKSLSNPDLVVAADGSLRVFFGGLGTVPNNALNTATAPATGASWSLQPGKAAQDTTAYASPSGAGTTKDGTPVSAWATTFGTRAHFGTSPGDADVAVQTQAQCCGYYPDVATADTAGRAVIGWYSNANGAEGLATQEIAATGPVGPKLFAPGTAGLRKTLSIDQRFAITSRQGGGVYVGYASSYPTAAHVNLWKFGAKAPAIKIKAKGVQDVNIASAPGGRLWLMWQRGGLIYITRTNAAATKAGPVRAVKPPAKTSTIWKLSGEGSRAGVLDLLVHASTPGSLATWHTQVKA
jgi:hypothetical protein